MSISRAIIELDYEIKKKTMFGKCYEIVVSPQVMDAILYENEAAFLYRSSAKYNQANQDFQFYGIKIKVKTQEPEKLGGE